MGSRGFGVTRRGSDGRLGSVSDYCVRHCVFPVMVVRYPFDKDENVGDDSMVTVTEAENEGVPEEEYHDAPDEHKSARKLGFPIFYGDGSRPTVLVSAGISSPKAVIIMYSGKKRTVEAVQRIRLAFPAVPIFYARAQDIQHLIDLKQSGVTDAILENTEMGMWKF